MDGLLKKTLLAALIAAAIYVASFLWFDRPVDLWIHQNLYGTWAYRAGTGISQAATSSYFYLGLALAMILVVVVDPRLEKRWTGNLLFVCLSCAAALIIGEGLKYLLGRHRPVMLFEQNLYGLTFFAENGAQHSSPSGHTLRAFSVLTALALLFRRWRYAFIAAAVLVGVSRVLVTAHYPGDVLFGAFIGVFSALWTRRYYFRRDETARRP